MTTDVNKAIQELLFEQTAVIVPGLGGFTSTPGTATVDYVQDITYQEAEALVESFVSSVRGTLERREIYEIPKVGRLYQDYEQKIRFMPEGTNFNAASFGLPTIEFQPLVKEKPKLMPTPPKPVLEEGVEASLPAGADAPTAVLLPDEPPTSMLMKVLPWMVLLAAILVALTLYKIFGGPREPIADLPQAAERINVKPNQPAEETATTETPANEPSDPVAAPNEDKPTTSTPIAEQPKTEPPKQATTQPKAENPPKTAVEPASKAEESANKIYLVVHSFGKQANASKFASTLKGDGYTTKTKKVGELYRVGVILNYNSQNDIEKARGILANKYKAGPKTEKELEEMGQ
jgi:cell division septation protein DedD